MRPKPLPSQDDDLFRSRLDAEPAPGLHSPAEQRRHVPLVSGDGRPLV